MNEQQSVPLMRDFYMGVTIHLTEDQRLNNPNNPTAILMQWVAVTTDEQGRNVYIHQFDENDRDDFTQKNVTVLEKLQDNREIIALFLIPRHQRLTENNLPLIEPRLWVSMLDGTMHINGVEYDVRPEHLKYEQIEYKFHYWKITREAHGPEGYPKHLRRYELGWHCQYGGQLYERLMFFDVVENIIDFSIKR